jgi:hypothetical protein
MGIVKRSELSSYYGWSRFVMMRSTSRCKIQRGLFAKFGNKSRILHAVRRSDRHQRRKIVGCHRAFVLYDDKRRITGHLHTTGLRILARLGGLKQL